MPNDPTASIGNPIWRTAVDMARLIGAPFRLWAAFVSKWLEQGAQRRHLRGLGDHMLRDIGISRRNIEPEIRPGWSNK